MAKKKTTEEVTELKEEMKEEATEETTERKEAEAEPKEELSEDAARMLGGRGVAFGPVFEDDDSRIHNSDESLDEEKFFKHFRICLEAMYKMMTYCKEKE